MESITDLKPDHIEKMYWKTNSRYATLINAVLFDGMTLDFENLMFVATVMNSKGRKKILKKEYENKEEIIMCEAYERVAIRLKEEERDNNSTTANSIPAGDKKNRLKARLENITSALKKLDKKLDEIEKDALKLSKDGKVLYETKIDLLNYAQKTKAELMRLISDDTTELKETQEKKIESGGRGLGEKVKESVGEFFGSLFGKKVELSLDNGLVTDFKKIINSTKNSSDNIQLKSILQRDFSDRKKIYESWYEYIYSSAEKFDKFFSNKGAQMNSNSARIVLMYIFLRSLVHAKLEDVNSIRKGLKTFVKDVTKIQPDIGNVDENIEAAGKIVLDICQILKNNIFTILNRKKNIKNVVKKSDCLKILEYVHAVDKDNDEKKFKKDLKSKFK